MADNYLVAIEGLSSLTVLDEMPQRMIRAARMAVNQTTRRAQAASVKEMRRQVNFPARYLSGRDSRLNISQFATDSNLEGKVTGRRRATSLARFVAGGGRTGGGAARQGGVNVEVKPGLARRMPGAFLMKLRSGGDGELGNVGLAIRTKPGKRPGRAYKPVSIGNNLWLLYGPSVDQVFRETRNTIRPDMENFMEREFLRLMELDL